MKFKFRFAFNVFRNDGYQRPRHYGQALDFFRLDANYFPESTKAIFLPEEIVEMGILPIGIKTTAGIFKGRKFLNVGFIHPDDKALVRKVEALAKARLPQENLAGIKPYLILLDEFLEVLRKNYGIDEPRVRELSTEGTIGPLQFLLDSASPIA